MASVKKAETVSDVSTDKFTKEQLRRSTRYRGYADVLSAVLKEGQMYSLEETDKLIDKYLKAGGK